MPEKDFEKQVQEKMEGLKLRPGDPVWVKIEKRIRKEKRKRIFFILPLVAGLLLLGYTGYRFFVRSGDQKNVATHELTTKESVPEIKNPQIDQEKQKANNDSGKNEPVNVATKNNRQTMIRNTVDANRKATIQRREVALRKPTIKVKPVENEQKNINETLIKEDDQKIVDSKPDSSVVQSSIVSDDQKVADSRPDSSVLQDLTAVVKPEDSSSRSGNTQPQDFKPEVPVKTKITADRKRPKFGFQVAAGISDIRSKPLSFSKTNPNLNVSAGGPIVGYPQGPMPTPISPSEIDAGKAFSIGLEWHKSFSRRSGFSTGLRYAYFSNEIKVGTRTNLQLQLAYDALNDKTLDDYYSGSQTDKFTNRYHFLEWPVEYHFRFNNNKKIGFDWATGLTLSWLISSNELMYDTIRGGIYFHSKDLFNRTQLGLLTGLSLRFRLRNDAAFLIGPQAYLDLSRMTKDGFDRNRYLFAGTIQARYIFPGKTKK